MQQGATTPVPPIEEFRHVHLDDDGVWHAEHERSDTKIEADTWERLVNRAIAVRIRTSIERSPT